MKNFNSLKISYGVIILLYSWSYTGMIFSQPVNINLSQNPAEQSAPCVSISHKDPNKAVCVWRDLRPGTSNAAYSYTTNGGITWSAPAFLDSTAVSGGFNIIDRPQICSDTSGYFYIVVSANNVLDTSRVAVYKSTNGGANFQFITVIPNSFKDYNRRPVIACDLSLSSPYTNTLYVGWAHPIFNHLISKSTDNGVTWSSPVDTRQFAYGPTIAINPNGQINQLSFGGHNARDIYYYNSSTDGGITFSESRAIDSGYTLSSYYPVFFPSIACDMSGGARNGNIYCTFSNGGTTGAVDCYLVRSTDNGNTWSPSIRITTDPFSMNVFHHKPYVTVGNNGRVAIVYYDFRNSPPPPPYYSNKGETWLALSNDGGLSFSNEKLSDALSPRSASSLGVNIGISYWGNRIIPVWTDRRDTVNYEIYTAVSELFTVSGNVTYKDNNQTVTHGLVKALYYDASTASIVIVDSTEIQPNGNYILSRIPKGDTLDIMFYQNDDELDFVPTYYVSTIDWREATSISATQNLTNINGQVYRINNNANPYNITGLATRNLEAQSPVGLKDAIIYAKIGNDFKNYGISYANGTYTTTKLPPGSYTLYAHRMGFMPITRNVTITNSSLSNINFDFGNPIGVTPTSSNIPAKYSLSQNYPNPFNPVTIIKFDIPKEGFVKLAVYDILGRETAVLINREMKAGSYSADWNASGLPSGIYFYRIESADFTETKKMVLIK